MIDLAIDGRLFIDDEIDAALQELDMIFNTENTELIGYSDYGTNFELFLWQLTPSTHELTKYILQKITNTLFLSQFNPQIHVDILNGEYRNIYQVKIEIENNGKVGYREYLFR